MVSEISVGDEVYPVACNAFTPIIFSREFSVTRKDGSSRPKDINEDVSAILQVQAAYAMPPIVPMLEIFYACAKTAGAKLKPFDDWVKSFPAEVYDLERSDGWAADVMQLVQQNFFPHAKDNLETETAEASDSATTAGA